MADRYRYAPVPIWNSASNTWDLIDFRNGQREVSWPPDFNSRLLPVPEYSEGDRVQFVRDETCAREGVVRLVLFQGDISRLKEGQGEMLDADGITYIVTARGHDHRIKASNILGRFVSLERIARVQPLLE